MKTKDYLFFLGKFFGCAMVGVFLWSFVAEGYTHLLLQAVLRTVGKLLLPSLGSRVLMGGVEGKGIASTIRLFFRGESFSVILYSYAGPLNAVVFVSLVLATPGEKWIRRARNLCIGLSIVFVFHFVWVGVSLTKLVVFPQWSGKLSIDILGPITHILPFALWVVFYRQKVFAFKKSS